MVKYGGDWRCETRWRWLFSWAVFSLGLMSVCFRNIEEMKQQLKELWKEGTHICSVPGPTGEQAKVRGYCCYISVVLMKKGVHTVQ